MRVLVVDDDAGLRRSLALILEDAGHEVALARGGEEGLAVVREGGIDLVLTDLRMPGMGGLDLVESLRAENPSLPVLLMTAYGSIEVAVEAVRRGAADFLPKPFSSEALLLALDQVMERSSLRREVERLRGELRLEHRFGEIVARSPVMVEALETAIRVARHPTSILITGPTGTGKELLARLIHRESERGAGPFVPVNCGAIPDGLVESTFFGYVRGAFSGADQDREGLFQAAAGGTLFLDEVGELPEAMQVKLLRVLQEGELRRVGDTQLLPVDVRIVAATNRELHAEVAGGRFREDLYYRIGVVTLILPPLRERPEDLPPLIQHLLSLHRSRLGVEVQSIDRGAMDALLAYGWPGNVRELENVLERALVLARDGTVRFGDLPPALRAGRGGAEGAPGQLLAVDALVGEEDFSIKRRGAALERALIVRALARTGGHRQRAAALLELSERALRYKIQEYDIDPENPEG